MQISGIFCFLVAFWAVEKSEQNENLKVSIYYEALCSDSVNFILHQLAPAYKVIGSQLLLDFVPYGKATQRKENGVWKFTCQHGPRECYGNKMQACAIDQNLGQNKNVAFITCVMGSRPASNGYLERCAQQTGFSWAEMTKCSMGKGDDLLAKYGDRTLNFDPIISFVPTIVYNDVFDSELQRQSLHNFLYIACSQLKNKPSECPKQNRGLWSDGWF